MARDPGRHDRKPDRNASERSGGAPVNYQDTRPNPPEGGGWDDETRPDLVTEDDGSGVAGGSSGGTGGSSNTAGHPDVRKQG